MCDEVEPAELYSRRPRAARKFYACDACGETIAAGTCYVAHSGLNDGCFWTIRQCRRCDAITSAIMSRADPRETIELTLDCGVSWVEAFGECPAEVAALAFALPGEALE